MIRDFYLCKGVKFSKCADNKSVPCNQCCNNKFKGDAVENLPFSELYDDLMLSMQRCIVILQQYSDKVCNSHWNATDTLSSINLIDKNKIEEGACSCMTPCKEEFVSLTSLTHQIANLCSNGINDLSEIDCLLCKIESILKSVESVGELVIEKKDELKHS